MSALLNLYFKKETLKTLLDVIEKKGEKGVDLTISVSDETNEYGQNVSSYVSQSKEDRANKKPKFYTSNGKVFWSDGLIVKAESKVSTTSTSELPF